MTLTIMELDDSDSAKDRLTTNLYTAFSVSICFEEYSFATVSDKNVLAYAKGPAFTWKQYITSINNTRDK